MSSVDGISALGRAVVAGRPSPSGDQATPRDRLREASRQMEGVFVQHLTRALRSTVPDGGSPDAPGADLYGSLLDEHLAEIVAGDTRTGIAEALYRQLSGLAGLDADGSVSSGDESGRATTNHPPLEGRRE